MKKLTKFFMAALLAGMCSLGYAQDYLKAPQPNEKIKEVMSSTDFPSEDADRREILTYTGRRSGQGWYAFFLRKAQKKYPNVVVDIRDIKYAGRDSDGVYREPVTCVVVYKVDAQTQWRESVSPGMDKAFRNVREGSRIAIDQVTVLNGMDREEFKDRIIDILLDKGYKIIAKEYLDKLYEEQLNQQSGVYNERTTVQENNFSAVGYYVNVKVTETSLRVQVINVSTGEYEGNATITF